MPASYTFNGQNWQDSSGRTVTGPLAAQLNDRARAQQAGVDYERVSKTPEYQSNFKKYGSGFDIAPQYGSRKSFGQGVIEGLGDYVAGGAQAIEHGLAAVGLNSGRSAEYFDALAKVRDQRLRDEGGTGSTIGRIFGNVAVPIPFGKAKAATLAGRLAEGAKVGAVGAAAMPTTGEGNYFAQKAGQATEGAIFGAPVNAALGKVVDAGVRARAPSLADVRYSAGERQGIPMGYAQITENAPTRMYANIGSKLPGGGALRKRSQQTIEGFDKRVEDVTSSTGRLMEKSDLGQHIENTFGSNKGGYIDRFTNKADDLFEDVTKTVPMTTQVDLSGTRKAMLNTFESFPSNPALGAALSNSRLKGFADALTDAAGNPKPLFFNEAQQLRSEVGKMLGAPQLTNDIPRRDLAMVYSALTDDMRKSLVDQPDALKAFDKASRFYRAGMNRIHSVIEPLLNPNSNEGIVNKLNSMLKSDANGMRTLRRSAAPEEWDTVAANIFHGLGQETPGAAGATGAGFNIPKFLTDFNKLRENRKAFDYAFGGTRYAHLRDTYGDLAEISDSIKHSMKMSNPSYSGYTGGAIALFSALLYNPMFTAKAVGSNFLASHIMASPRIARWLVKGGRIIKRGQQGNAKAAELLMKAHIAKLPGIAASDSSLSQGIGNMYEALGGGQ